MWVLKTLYAELRNDTAWERLLIVCGTRGSGTRHAVDKKTERTVVVTSSGHLPIGREVGL